MFSEELPSKADVVIIGGGVIGCAIARALSKYDLEIVLIEKEPDVGFGVSKGNAGVIHPFVPQMKKLKGKMCVEGNKRFDEISKELDVPFKRVGLLIVALTFLEFFGLIFAYLFLKKHKIKVQWIWRKTLRKLEPNITPKAKAALFVPSAGILDPVEYTIALAENAAKNGVKIVLNTKVTGFEVENNRIVGVITDRGVIRTKVVINTAGLYADEISRKARAEEVVMNPGKGAMIVFSESIGNLVSHIIAEMPLRIDPRTKGGAIIPTINGKTLWGPNLTDVETKEDVSVTQEDISLIIEKFSRLLKNYPLKMINTFFAGVRPAIIEGDFIIRKSKVRGLIQVLGIESPGLTASPVIADKVIELIKDEVELKPKHNFNPTRKGITRVKRMKIENLDELIKKDPKYGRIICLCEMVSEAEIVEAIKRGARTLDSIKFRTNAMKGDCHGERCLPKILRIIKRELSLELKDITKKGKGSEIFVRGGCEC